MDKMGYPSGLIRYTTESALEHEYAEKDIKKRLLRPRVAGYGAVLAVVVAAFLVGLSTRKMVEVDILKDRGVMVRENAKGWLENAYSLRIINNSEKEQLITASVKGFDEIALTGLPEGGIKVAARNNNPSRPSVHHSGIRGQRQSSYRVYLPIPGKRCIRRQAGCFGRRRNLYRRITVSQNNPIKPWYKHVW